MWHWLCAKNTTQQSVNSAAWHRENACKNQSKCRWRHFSPERICTIAQCTDIYANNENDCSHHVVKVNLINDKQRRWRRRRRRRRQHQHHPTATVCPGKIETQQREQQQNDWATRRKWNKKGDLKWWRNEGKNSKRRRRRSRKQKRMNIEHTGIIRWCMQYLRLPSSGMTEVPARVHRVAPRSRRRESASERRCSAFAQANLFNLT